MYRFDPDVHVGSVLTDDGLVIPFSAAAFATSGLRHVRPGQRLNIELAIGAPEIVSMRLETIRGA